MAESAEDEAFAFYKPHLRGLIPITGLHIPHSLLKTLRQKKYRVTINQAFREIIDGCATSTERRAKTWINKPIRDIFIQLQREGHAYSIEVWDKEQQACGRALRRCDRRGLLRRKHGLVSKRRQQGRARLSMCVAMEGWVYSAGYAIHQSAFAAVRGL